MKSIGLLTCGAVIGGAVIAFFAFGNDKLPSGSSSGKNQQGMPVAGNPAHPANGSATPDREWPYRWQPPQVPDSISFAGEETPLERWDVHERLDRELLVNSYLHGTTLYIIKLANRVFPVLEERLKANGIPEDFKYLCVAESALQNQRSPAGALGYWQFLSSTGREHGLEISDQVDERYHLEKATDAACKYLRSAYNRFGSWTAAAASYNCGMGGYSRFSSHQQTRNYYDLLLPEETNRYIFRILALKYILEDPQRSGFITEAQDLYQEIPTREVRVSQSIPSLVEFAKREGTSYKILKTLNPWLRAHSLNVRSGKVYTIRVPE